MTNKKINRFSVFMLMILVVVLFDSCIPQRKLTYLQELETSTTQIDSTGTNKNYRLKAKDEVFIKINSIDPKTYEFFNGGDNSNAYAQNSELSLYISSYTLDDSGTIVIPIAGRISLLNLTIPEASRKLELMLQKYLTEVSVVMKLTGFKVTLLGEVKNPGRHTAYVTQLNILEAIALGGDLTEFGNRKRVMIIREINGIEEIYYVDLLDRNLVKSKYFNLLPNDIIYIEALRAKTYGFSQFPYALVLSSITTFITLMTFLKIQ